MPGILSGLRVVELSAFVAAPLGGMTLAQLGADVIRIDRPQGGLDYRRWPVTKDNVSLFWAGLNKSKRSVAIDISRPEGRELAQALITAEGEDAGMMLTNFPARGWLAYENLQRKRKDLIQLAILGDRAGGSAVDYTINPKMGLPFLTGPEGYDGVVNHVLPTWDLITGQMAALGLLAAERQRRKTGVGQLIKLPLEDVALAVMGHLGFIAEAQLGMERERCGNDLFGAFGRDFLTADDERVMVVGLSLKQWQSLCKATSLGVRMTDLAAKLGVNLELEGERFKARNEIAELIGEWVGKRAYAEVAKAFDQEGVCWGRYQTVSQLVNDGAACSLQNPLFNTIEQPGIGQLLAPAIPLDFGSGRREAEPAPVLGADTESVLMDLLGLNSAEFGKFHDEGLVGTPHQQNSD